jgi:hypothetical protein
VTGTGSEDETALRMLTTIDGSVAGAGEGVMSIEVDVDGVFINEPVVFSTTFAVLSI